MAAASNCLRRNDAFSKAEDIYQAMSSQEGLAEVHYQMGSLLARIRKLPEAKEQLERSLAMSRGSSSEYQAIRTSLQLSNVYYATGDSNHAKAIAADAVKAAQLLNSRTLATNGLIDLGYTLLARGEFAETRAYLHQALDLARQDKSPRLEARARLALGSLSTQEGSFDEAVSHLESALKFYQPAGYRTETSNALILLGRVYRDKGEYAVAMKAFSEQLELAKQSGDPARLAATHSSIGVLLGDNQELYAEALPYFDGELSDQQVARRTRQHGMGSGQSRGVAVGVREVRRSQGRSRRSLCHRRRAGSGIQVPTRIRGLIGAQMALSLGDRVEATTRATAALKLAERDYKDTALQAKQTLALIAGDFRRAEKGGGPCRGSRGRGQGVETSPAAVDSAARLGRSSPRRRRRTGRARRCAGGTEGVRLGGTTGIGVARVAGVGEVPCGLRATARLPTITPSAPRPVERLSRLAGATTTTAGYARRPDIQVRLKQLGQLLGAKTIVQRTRRLNMAGKEGDPGGGQGGGGKKKPAKKATEEEVAR